MLVDHIGAYLVPWLWLRAVGRIAFPIFCFLLTQGVIHTRNPKRYALRLCLFAIISELPFDLLRFGGFDMAAQSVMVTLLLGFGMLMLLRDAKSRWLQIGIVGVFMLAAELTKCEYGSYGVGLIAVLALTEGRTGSMFARALALAYPGVMAPLMGGSVIQIFATLALIPLSLYTGRSISRRKGVKWAFYLFYPVHLAIIYYFLFLL